MNKLLLFLLVLISCAHQTKHNSSQGTVTLDLPPQEEPVSIPVKNNEQFNPSAVKANRKKTISLYIDDLHSATFSGVGVIKWLERHGYKIKNAYAQGFGSLLLVPYQEKKKASYLEWKLHQWSKEDFPLESESDVDDLINKLKIDFNLPAIESSNYVSCEEYSSENQDTTVICLLNGKKDKLQLKTTGSGMDLVKFNIAPIDLKVPASLVDHIDRGFNLAQQLKGPR